MYNWPLYSTIPWAAPLPVRRLNISRWFRLLSRVFTAFWAAWALFQAAFAAS